ncbi:MAG TPA: hypothetical protein VN436_17120, partial [Holophaga sp.]|nr:hypothetical protein [Holophaga sp.]
MKPAFRIALAALMTSACLWAGDLTIAFRATSKGMGASGEGVQTQYYSTTFQKTADEGTKVDTMIDYGKGVFYTIRHKDKKIEMMTFDDLAAIGEAMEARMSQTANMPKFLQGMMGGNPGDVKVDKLGDDTVAGRACKKYKVTVGKVVEELSLDPSLKPPVNPAAFAKFSKLRGNMYAGPAGASMKKMVEELSKLQGMALKTHVSGFMGMD